MTQIKPEFGPRHDREAVARASGLRDGDIDPSSIETVSTGVPFTIAPLRGLAITRDLRINMKGSEEDLQRSGGNFFYFVSRQTVWNPPPGCTLA